MESNNDKNQRILSYLMSYKLTEKEINEIAGGNMSQGPSFGASGARGQGANDVHGDWTVDF